MSTHPWPPLGWSWRRATIQEAPPLLHGAALTPRAGLGGLGTQGPPHPSDTSIYQREAIWHSWVQPVGPSTWQLAQLHATSRSQTQLLTPPPPCSRQSRQQMQPPLSGAGTAMALSWGSSSKDPKGEVEDSETLRAGVQMSDSHGMGRHTGVKVLGYRLWADSPFGGGYTKTAKCECQAAKPAKKGTAEAGTKSIPRTLHNSDPAKASPGNPSVLWHRHGPTSPSPFWDGQGRMGRAIRLQH